MGANDASTATACRLSKGLLSTRLFAAGGQLLEIDPKKPVILAGEHHTGRAVVTCRLRQSCSDASISFLTATMGCQSRMIPRRGMFVSASRC